MAAGAQRKRLAWSQPSSAARAASAAASTCAMATSWAAVGRGIVSCDGCCRHSAKSGTWSIASSWSCLCRSSGDSASFCGHDTRRGRLIPQLTAVAARAVLSQRMSLPKFAMAHAVFAPRRQLRAYSSRWRAPANVRQDVTTERVRPEHRRATTSGTATLLGGAY